MSEISSTDTSAAYKVALAATATFLTAFDAAFAPIVAVTGGLPDVAANARRGAVLQQAQMQKALAALPVAAPPASGSSAPA